MILCIMLISPSPALYVPSLLYVWRIQMQRRYSPLFQVDITIREREMAVSGLPRMFSVCVDKTAVLFNLNEIHVIYLVTNHPDFVELGQPGNGQGILSSALPTVETVIEGVERITPELLIMALGYATGKGCHTGTPCISASCTLICPFFF